MRTKLLILAGILALSFAAVMGNGSRTETALAHHESMVLPWDRIQDDTWHVCQGYRSTVTPTFHKGDDKFSLDLVADESEIGYGNGCDGGASSAKDKTIVSPVRGIVAWIGKTSTDIICIDTDDGFSVKLGHASWSAKKNDPVAPNDPIGTVNGPDGLNGNVAHIHVSLYDGRGCGVIVAGVVSIPLNARLEGANFPDNNRSDDHWGTSWTKPAPAGPPKPPQGTIGQLDVVLVIDSSGSMSQNDPNNDRIKAARAFASASWEDDRIGILDFDSSTRDLLPLTPAGKDKAAIFAPLTQIDSNGGTEIDDALARACQILESQGTSSERAVLLLTDGDNNTPYDESVHRCFSDHSWPVYALGFGQAVESRLKNVAESTGGKYRHWKELATIADLSCEFQRMRAEMTADAFSNCQNATIFPQQTIAYLASVATNQKQATFSSSWIGSDVEMTLVAPSGREIGRLTSAGDVVHDLGPSWESYTIANPEAGEWTVKLYGLDVPAEGEDVVFNYITLRNPDTGVSGGSGPPNVGGEVPLKPFAPDLSTSDAPHVAPTVAAPTEVSQAAPVVATPTIPTGAAPTGQLPPAIRPTTGVTGLVDAGGGSEPLLPMAYVWALGVMSIACALLAGGVALGGRRRVHRRQ